MSEYANYVEQSAYEDGLYRGRKESAKRIAELEAENTRIVSESKQCHEQNDRLCAEHMELGKRIAQLEADNAALQKSISAACERIKDAEEAIDELHAGLDGYYLQPGSSTTPKHQKYIDKWEALEQKDEND